MSGMSDYALEKMLELRGKTTRKRKTKNEERGNVPSAVQSANVDEEIQRLLALGWDSELVTQHLLDWNRGQPSPMAVGKLKKRLYLASQRQVSD